MRLIINLLAIIGLVALVGVGIGYTKVNGMLSEFGVSFSDIKALPSQLDPKAMDVYKDFFQKFIKTKDPGDAMVWSFPVDEGLSVDEVKESLTSLATDRNFLFVGESPFYKQAEAVTGKPYRYVNFMSFCDVRVGIQMADYNNAYTAFMPCRISIVEDKEGKLWLYSMNLDFMIHGGKELPPELKENAIKVRNTILTIMENASHGEF
ncbi:DUF302 domain-containing protein [Candidatus Parabeggiatoa sp. HSG14]|uniref:DUF302 domain-containing protein n=1 Tax=Candidatus Parabeggiatoa sp. HSG14 TaxID=3055593 RepID=UPI0025A8C92C|nr:DUF302 domain-containing protein [Thiotrichales bacterium HSG14]